MVVNSIKCQYQILSLKLTMPINQKYLHPTSTNSCSLHDQSHLRRIWTTSSQSEPPHSKLATSAV